MTINKTLHIAKCDDCGKEMPTPGGPNRLTTLKAHLYDQGWVKGVRLGQWVDLCPACPTKRGGRK
jgi:hypothetical protein